MKQSVPGTSPAVYLLAAIISAVGAVLSHNWESFSPPPTNGVDGSVDLDRAPEVMGGAAPEAGFGTWIRADVRIVYRAETDGFVAAYTNGGNDGLRINVGRSPDRLATRGRARSYDGAMTPVSKDHYWVVIPNDHSGDVRVSWLPVGSSGE